MNQLMARMLCAATLICAFAVTPTFGEQADDFWQEQRAGANSFNGAPPDLAYFEAAHDAGITWMRLTWSKWPSAAEGAQEGWFLQGDPANYNGLVREDLDVLRRVVDDAEKAGVRVVLVPLSLPGLLWRQHNDDVSDARLWTDETYHEQAAVMWRDLAVEFRDHPAVVAYNLVNEPHPARTVNGNGTDPIDFAEDSRDTPADLDRLYKTIAAAIREVDADTPIMLDGPDFASTQAITALRPLPNELGPVLYSAHMYEPWSFTSWNMHKGEWSYPGVMPLPWGQGDTTVDADFIDEKFRVVDAWLSEYDIPVSQFVLGEYGIQRINPGAAAYLHDVRHAADSRGW
ncbi:MAG: cellulase family glycosylhydrolase, partial [Planctomycetota bacterium]